MIYSLCYWQGWGNKIVGRQMEPIYIDIHIHTSENPDSLNTNYDVTTLFSKVNDVGRGAMCLISLTDHNTINKDAYKKALAALPENIRLLLGVELHVKNYKESPAYHCHIIFKSIISEDVIDDINKILDILYPAKQVEKMDEKLPTLEVIIKHFDDYEFILLPHGGQSHATFDTSIPDGVKFDTTMERSIYYNQFEGYTARAKEGLETTIDYFKRLGINEFVNLITCTDNYNPQNYPQAKDSHALPHIPTWMFAEPSFDGLRLSLSESSRFVYSQEKPSIWSETIKSATLSNEKIEIDVKFSPGLNVVIGGSSSGKTLLVDSIAKKLANDSFEESSYRQYDVKNIDVINPSGFCPHYISQNYIMKVVNIDTSDKIEDIDIIKRLFPVDINFQRQINEEMGKFKTDISDLISSVEHLEDIESQLSLIPNVGSIYTINDTAKNIIKPLVPDEISLNKIAYNSQIYSNHIQILDEIKSLIARNPFADLDVIHIETIRNELKKLYEIGLIGDNISQIIKNESRKYDEELREKNQEDQTKVQQQTKLLELIKQYIIAKRKFDLLLDKISKYDVAAKSRETTSMNHKLYIQNRFSLSKQKIIDVFNYYLKTPLQSYESVTPQSLYKINYKQRPKVDGYDDFVNKVYNKMYEENKTIYKITTKDGIDFDSLSAGWKTSVLLDLIFGATDDIAPIIIDQPEDNLATNYINEGLVNAIKQVKNKKQIILVSHNATIPMMADAQTIIYCENNAGKITIKSAPLEGYIGDKSVLDLIATITDGGKSSIKKRVKKYNLKRFK